MTANETNQHPRPNVVDENNLMLLYGLQHGT